MTISTARAQHRETVRGTILGAARSALIREGYGSFSMRGVAAEVGCSAGTIYLYFKSKEHLLNCVVDEGFDKLLEVLDEVHTTSDPVRSLKNKLRAYVDFGLRYPHHYHVAFIVRRSGRAVTTDGRPHQSFDVLRDSVRECVEQGHFASSDIELTSQTLWTAIHGVTSLMIVMPKFPWVDREQLIDQVIDTAIEGTCRSQTIRLTMGGRRDGD